MLGQLWLQYSQHKFINPTYIKARIFVVHYQSSITTSSFYFFFLGLSLEVSSYFFWLIKWIQMYPYIQCARPTEKARPWFVEIYLI